MARAASSLRREANRTLTVPLYPHPQALINNLQEYVKEELPVSIITGFNGSIGCFAGLTVTTLTTILSLALTMTAANAADSKYIYQFTYQAGSVEAEVSINGVPIVLDKIGYSGTGSAPLNIWLKPEDNVLTVKLKGLPKSKPGDSSHFKMFIARAEAGQYNDEGERIVEFDWDSDSSKEKLPVEKKFDLKVKPPYTLELWTKADVLKLDADTEKAARAYLKAVSDAYVKADSGKIAEYNEFSLNDFSRANYQEISSLAQSKKDLKEFFGMLKEQKAKFAPINAAKAKLQLVADGRLIMVTDKDGKPPLVAKSADGGEFINPIYLGRVGGKWVVAR